MFSDTLSVPELSAWRLLMSAITNFLGNKQGTECEIENDDF